jgi:DNA-binding protein H-NS
MEVYMSDNTETAPSGRQTKRTHAIDLKEMSAAQLRELIANAQTELLVKQESAKSDLRAKWQAEAEEAGLTLDAVTAVGGGKAKPRKAMSGSSVAVKYRGPNGEEWSGRGRSPKWVQTIEAEGGNRDQFKI